MSLKQFLVDLATNADVKRRYADDPDGVGATVTMAMQAGLAGCSIEDYTRDDEAPIYDLRQAAERVAAAAETAHGGSVHMVLTARAENYLHGRPDLADTIFSAFVARFFSPVTRLSISIMALRKSVIW